VGLALLAGLVFGVGLPAWKRAHRTDLQRALAFAPKDAQRYSWTDWSGVRRALGLPTRASALKPLLSKGYDADLTPGSSVLDSTDLLASSFGFSPATMSWELLTQSTTGAALWMKLPDSVSFDDVAVRLRAGGYSAPRGSGGVWDGSAVDVGGVPILSYVALDAADHLVVTSDTDSYLAQVMAHRGDGALPQPMSEVAAAVGEPLSAELYGGDYTCSKLAMGQADPTDEAQGDELINQAGEVSPVLGFAMAREPDSRGRAGDVRVALAFADHTQAVTNATTRAKLASGEAPGQGGSFRDRFRLGRVEAEGNLVTMQLLPRPGSFVLSDLSTGPLLFATC